MHTEALPCFDVGVPDERRSRWFLLHDVELILAHTNTVNDVERYWRKGEPADESNEEAARRAPESSHVRVLLHTAAQTKQWKLHRLIVNVHLWDPALLFILRLSFSWILPFFSSLEI